ncbi:AMP-dependent synthetase [Nocardiopsis sp. NRRL B-16309]|uniref:AMP-dependent synthetase n=1 Tax=Nocardiopsis sp. NRRL B-16309 TaxID=1519494 RepID=UPI000A8B1BDB|nr:AMP-dependent synthetase [Nocardiopsis sp. NRRL B-16309]
MTMTFEARVSRRGGQSLRQALARLSRIPVLRDKYGSFTGSRPLDLADLPTLARDELGRAIDALVRSDPAALTRASLHVMGGTRSTMRLGAVPSDLYLDEIAPHVRPLEPGDLLVTLSTPFHMRACHDLHNALAARAGVPTLSMDAPTDQMIDAYLDLFERHGVTALATTLDTLRSVLRFCAASGRDLGFLRKVLWSGPAMDADTRSLIRTHFPHLRAWSLFGSAETWIIGHSGPDCAVDTFHPLPYQHTEITGGRMLVTVTHGKAVIPLLRYDTGTTAEWTTCPCGLPGRAVRTHSRIDAPQGPLSRLVSPHDLVPLALQVDSVEAAQVMVVSPHTEDERLHLRVRLRPGTETDLYTAPTCTPPSGSVTTCCPAAWPWPRPSKRPRRPSRSSSPATCRTSRRKARPRPWWSGRAATSWSHRCRC